MSQTASSSQASPERHTMQENDVLLRQALEDEDSRKKLYRGVAIYAHKFLGSCEPEAAQARAEEIVQEAVTQALAKIDIYDSARSAVNWLLGFAINVIRQTLRDQGRTASMVEHTPLDQLEDLVDRFHGQEAQELLSLVSAPEQEVLRLAIIEELSGRDLAAELGISEGAARVRLHRAKQQLRRAYEQLL